MYTKHSLRMAT